LLRVLHLTDPHLFAAKDGSLRGTVTYDSLAAVLAHYQAGAWRADIVVVTGDIIQDDSAGAYVHFRDLLGALALPVFCVPGNHDVRELMQEALAAPPFQYCATLQHGDWLLVGLDSCVDARAGGRISEAEFTRLDRAVAATEAAHVMLCLHHPPVTLGSEWLDSVGMANGREALSRFAASGKVRLAIFGHVHQDFAAQHSGMEILATPSTCSQFVAGSKEFAIDTRPPAYRRLELHPDGTHSNELIWVSEA
jgi:Icc protein